MQYHLRVSPGAGSMQYAGLVAQKACVVKIITCLVEVASRAPAVARVECLVGGCHKVAVPRPAVILHLFAEHLASSTAPREHCIACKSPSGVHQLLPSRRALRLHALTGSAAARCAALAGAPCGRCASRLPAPAMALS